MLSRDERSRTYNSAHPGTAADGRRRGLRRRRVESRRYTASLTAQTARSQQSSHRGTETQSKQRRQDKRTTKPNWTILLRDHRRRPRETDADRYDPRRDDSCMSAAIPSTIRLPLHHYTTIAAVPGVPCNVICLKLLPIYTRGLAGFYK